MISMFRTEGKFSTIKCEHLHSLCADPSFSKLVVKRLQWENLGDKMQIESRFLLMVYSASISDVLPKSSEAHCGFSGMGGYWKPHPKVIPYLLQTNFYLTFVCLCFKI